MSTSWAAAAAASTRPPVPPPSLARRSADSSHKYTFGRGGIRPHAHAHSVAEDIPLNAPQRITTSANRSYSARASGSTGVYPQPDQAAQRSHGTAAQSRRRLSPLSLQIDDFTEFSSEHSSLSGSADFSPSPCALTGAMSARGPDRSQSPPSPPSRARSLSPTKLIPTKPPADSAFSPPQDTDNPFAAPLVGVDIEQTESEMFRPPDVLREHLFSEMSGGDHELSSHASDVALAYEEGDVPLPSVLRAAVPRSEMKDATDESPPSALDAPSEDTNNLRQPVAADGLPRTPTPETTHDDANALASVQNPTQPRKTAEAEPNEALQEPAVREDSPPPPFLVEAQEAGPGDLVEERTQAELQEAEARELASSSGSAESAAISGDANLEMLMVKGNVYLRLKDWEEDQMTRTEKLHWLLDSLVDELAAGAQAARETNQQIIKLVRDRIKISQECATKIRVFNAATAPRPTRPISRGTLDGSAESGSSASAADGSFGGSNPFSTEGLPRPPPGASLHVYPPTWLKGLIKCSERESGYLTSFSESVDSEILRGKLAALDEYDRTVSVLLAKLKEARSKLWSHNKEVRKSWQEFQKLFKEVEKARFATTLRSSGQGSTVGGGTVTSASPHASKITSTTKESSPVTTHRDTWLAERKYLHAALTAHQMQLSYLSLLNQGVEDMRHLEHWRAKLTKESLLLYIAKSREMLGLLATNLGSAHSLIDPDGYAKAKTEFLSRDSSPPSPPPPQRATNDPEPPAERSPAPVTADSILSPRGAEASTETLSQTSKVLFDSAKELLANVVVPEAQLVIKKGHVRRMAGLFGKWSEGLLVLTWDRLLHMFRSFDDMQPVWSTYVPLIDVRLTDEHKNGIKTVEIRDKRNLLGVLGAKSLCFRAYTDDELASWLKCLSLASSADDRTFREEGLQSARNADQKALEDYRQWVHTQETLSSDVLYAVETTYDEEPPMA